MSASRPKIREGYRVGRLTVAAPTARRKNGYMVWRCRCDCGGEILLDTRCLQRGTVQDCGCATPVRPGQKDLTGQRFGRLVCIAPTEERGPGGGTVWKCRCDCGQECLAVSTQLTQGYKKSCGCLSHPPLKDLVGRRFGMLTVLEYAGKWDGMHRWHCLCDCGNETVVGQTLLQSGRTKSCGCNGHPPIQDLTSQRFGQLTALEEVERKNGASYWRCRCSCGNETVVRYTYLISGHTRSCGCLQKKQIVENLRLVDGTSVTILETMKHRLIKSNTSGYNGVYQEKRTGKWRAQITFKGKTYYLGRFDKIEEAVEARRRGEEMHEEFLTWYYQTHGQEGSAQKEDVQKAGLQQVKARNVQEADYSRMMELTVLKRNQLASHSE